MTRRRRPEAFIPAFGIAFAGTLVVAMLQEEKIFYFDSYRYWHLAGAFIKHGHFSLLNFDSVLRGYALPLLYGGLHGIAKVLAWSQSALAKLFNVVLFALIGAVLAPRFAELAWPTQRWGILRRLALTTLLIFFWSGYLNFPLSDFPALAMALLTLVAIARPAAPGWMLLAGLAGGLAIDFRAAYLPLVPILVVFVAWTWLAQRNAQHASIAHRGLCLGLLILGFAAVSLPQSLAAHRHYGTWSFVPGAALSVAEEYLTPGVAHQLYATYVGPGELRPGMFYDDEAGLRLLREQKDGRIDSSGQYVGLLVSHPITMGGLFSWHLVNGLDQRYSTPYVEHLNAESWLHRGLRSAGFLLVFLALVRVLWPTARRRLGPARWRYPVALSLCCLTSLLLAVETRFLLPLYLLAYILVLMPGWPNPIGAPEAGFRRFRIPTILAVGYLAFMVVVWHVLSGATSHLRFG